MATATETTKTTITYEQVAEQLKEAYSAGWKWLLVVGIVSTLAGIASVVYPVAASVAVGIFIVAMIAGAGCANLLSTFFVDKQYKLESFLIGTVQVLLAAVMAAYPLQSMATLTLLVAAVLALEGVLRISMAWIARSLPGWGWAMLGGIATLALSILILTGMPQTSMWVIGLLVGVNMLINGATRIGVSLAARQVEKDVETVEEELEKVAAEQDPA